MKAAAWEDAYFLSETVVFADEFKTVVGIILDGRNAQVNRRRLLDDGLATSPVFTALFDAVGSFILVGRELDVK